jgi:hypothetical protein
MANNIDEFNAKLRQIVQQKKQSIDQQVEVYMAFLEQHQQQSNRRFTAKIHEQTKAAITALVTSHEKAVSEIPADWPQILRDQHLYDLERLLTYAIKQQHQIATDILSRHQT